MHQARVVLLGGTSHVGKSSLARVVADRLGYACLSTDGLARHPGRPWRMPGWEVPPHVAEHYRSLTADELLSSVLDHYARLWPRVEELIRRAAAGHEGAAGLVLEGSALWPARVAELRIPHTAAVWLTAEETVLRARMYDSAGYAEADGEERRLVDTFLARAVGFQELVLGEAARLRLDRLDTGGGRSVEELAEAVLRMTAAR
ncbi:hypothetical protein [Streptomyces physcomitrii]|uniref:2-phosphoglycerate kinase n=1 Tax=Streptomyces physcomitrii TaxID=2724184 RepID=A0ABX1H6F0_9ACTN|nr:hypothetical protein [Streptomyces physcomitrii]NKI43642.1 hypothetical protein [Streptomyces physcomitrii]